jgi:single-strand DNA-binding protein
MLNSVVLIGRLVADPQHRMTQTGKGVANLRIAVDRKGREKESDFFDITAWGQTADFQVRTYTDKENNERKAFEIVADSVQPLDSNRSVDGKVSPPPAVSLSEEITDPFAE